MISFDRKVNRKKRKQRSSKIFGIQEKPRVVFNKSNRFLTVQAVDDSNQHTIIFASSKKVTPDASVNQLTSKKNFKSKDFAESLGVLFAKQLSEKGISTIVFDRNGYSYHGKVKIFCDSMRKLGISF